MLSRARRLSQDAFIRDNGVFFVGSIGVALLNYLYYPVLGRLLPVADFGDMQALLAIFGQAMVINIVFGTVLLNIEANRGSGDPAARDLSTLFFWLSTLVTVGALLATPVLSRLFQLRSPAELVFMAAAFPVATLAAAANSRLQAAKRFGAVSLSSAIAAGGKLVAGAVLVWWGFGAIGAAAAFLLANIFACVYAVLRTGPARTFDAFRLPRLTPAVRSELRYGFLILCGVGMVLTLSSGDVAVVKALFAPDIAGYYGGVSAIGRVVFFATASISAVLLPHVRLEQPAAERRALLWKSVALTAAVGTAVCLPLMAAPAWSVSLLLGGRYLPLASLLPWMALQSLLLAVANVFVMFAIATRQASVAAVSVSGLVATGALLAVLHASPTQVVWVFLGATAAVLAVMAVGCGGVFRYGRAR